MLGKLYITAVSSLEKLQTVSDLVAEAIDTKIAMDGPTRNALNKIQAALNKALGDAGTNRQSIEANEDPTQALDQMTLNQEVEDEEGRMDVDRDEEEKRLKDVLLEELLDEEDEDL